MANQRITELAEPNSANDASTKSYVDVSLNAAVVSVNNYTDVSLNAAVVSVKSYSDVSLNAAVVSVKQYSDASLNAAVVSLKQYSDVSLNAVLTKVRMQVGDIKMSIRSDNHQGWVKCDGSAVSRSTYSALFSLVGISFGAGDNVDTFNLPNAGGKVLGTVYGLRHPLGSVDGSENHILTTGELPEHQHTYQDAYFAENYGNPEISGNARNKYGTGAGTDLDNGFVYRTQTGYSRNPNDSDTFLSTGSGPGTGAAFSVMQPTLFIGNTFIYSGVNP